MIVRCGYVFRILFLSSVFLIFFLLKLIKDLFSIKWIFCCCVYVSKFISLLRGMKLFDGLFGLIKSKWWIFLFV